MLISEIIEASKWLPIDQMTKFLSASAAYSGARQEPEEPEPGEDTAWYAMFVAYKAVVDSMSASSDEETKEERKKRLRSEQNHRYYMKHRHLKTTESDTDDATDELLEDSYELLENSDDSERENEEKKVSKEEELEIEIEKKESISKEIPKKEERHRYGEYSNVLLSDSDLSKLKDEFPSDWEDRIERLSVYMASTGKSYKNHLATIRNWARRNKDSPDRKTSKFAAYDARLRVG